ncbi:MBL fold metallo-hydrolase [Halospina sp. K52047b]|uniref:MBL fold metallo-hydrolase n=1 Tax=Halospina sp. K52047b TaxID=2614160 RepID=UPI00124A54C5|nr:MBL fold metallo-hydrolase [Halospina sp. K52047b]KAA8977819.1 MBL fold metallo-hydrolase [Halospina sp. K52047b]
MTEIREAATLVLARDGAGGPEVLLLRRTRDAVFLPGFDVFPGGAVSDLDGALVDRTTALRECFEEAGVLVVRDDAGGLTTHTVPELDERRRLDAGEQSLADYCGRAGLTPAADGLFYLGRWITPPGPPRRFDTRFFLAPVPAGQTAWPDGTETTEAFWLTPEQALEEHGRGERLLVPPTLGTLRQIRGFRSVADLVASMAYLVPYEAPAEDWPIRNSSLAAGAAGYDEARFLDPAAGGHTTGRIEPGEAVAITPAITRLTAPNPGVMTGPGTNTYILRTDEERLVVDPGPDDGAHVEAILAATGGRIDRILLTHTHLDHTPASHRLRERTGARLVFRRPAGGLAHHDYDLAPDHEPADGDYLVPGLRVLSTPGHAANHLAFLWEPDGLLLAGDLVMQSSTVVIDPPDGHLGDYLATLRRLLDEPVAYLLPGHGQLMADPWAVFDYLITHRHRREHKVLDCLAEAPEGIETEALLPRVYDDVPAAIHPVAARSLEAHLEKLVDEGRVQRSGYGVRLVS